MDYPEEELETVIWSDETKQELFGISNTCHVYSWKSTELHPKNTITTVKHGGNIVVWD